MTSRAVLRPVALLATLAVGARLWGGPEGDGAVGVQDRAHPPSISVMDGDKRVIFDRRDYLVWESLKELDRNDPMPDMRAVLRDVSRRIHEAPQQPLPMRLFADVFVVAYSGGQWRNYVVDCGDGFLLIDPGDPHTRHEVVGNIGRLHFRTNAPRWVYNTHCHFDHAANSKFFQDQGSEILIHEGDANALATANHMTGANSTLYRSRNTEEYRPCVPDRILHDGDILRLGTKTFYVLHTPGHSPGSACLLLQHDARNILFGGDTASFLGRMGAMGSSYGSFTDYLESTDKLLRISVDGPLVSIDAILPGHGTIVMSDGDFHLQLLRKNVQWVIDQRNAGDNRTSVNHWEAWPRHRRPQD